ncbi:MAG TPA: NHL repeat-containing protein [Lacipirellulaceae bacterium]|nr:NHL repeat-containing protein [Lacipirellulaceae bacterium]
MNGNLEISFIGRRGRFLLAAMALLSCVVAANSAGATTLFVSDGVDDVVHRFDATTGAAISPNIPLVSVTGVATSANGDVYAASSNPAQVYRYNSTTGAQIGGPFVTFNGQNDGHDVQGPEGMAFAPNGNLYISDVTESNVHIYDTAGNSVGVLGSAEMSQPTDVAFSAAGDLYVVNPGMADVLVSVGGTQPLTEFFGPLTGGLTIPQALTFGPDGKLYVLDASNNGGPAIRRYTAGGADDGAVVSYATSFFQPNDIAFGPDGKLYVSGVDLEFGTGEVLRYLANGTADGMLVSSGPSYPTFMTFSGAVPEPGTLTLLVMAAIPLWWRQR